MSQTQMEAGQLEICSICLALLDGDPRTTHACDGCGAMSHSACHKFLGGCAAYGCARMVEATKPDGEGNAVTPLDGGHTCPMCAEAIFQETTFCPYCDTPIDPPAAAPAAARKSRRVVLPKLPILIALAAGLLLLGCGALLFGLSQAAGVQP